MKIIYSILLLFIFSKPGFTEDALKVSLPSFLPFYDQSDPSKGSITKLYSQIEEKLGVKIIIMPLPYTRILKHLKSGEVDAAILFKNENLKNDIFI